METETKMNGNSPKIIVFTGTSISHSNAGEILEAVYMPPVQRCDVERSVKAGYNIIGIIDGTFFNRTAVAHREIIKALRNGVIVIGGASMGALRASELDTYGMIGIGKIYEWYRDGVLDADDEVAVATNPDTYEAVSSPMVNIRQTLQHACEKQIIDDATKEILIQIGKQMHYTYRSYMGIMKKAVDEEIISANLAEDLLDFCMNNEVDVKRKDALKVLERIKEIAGHK